MSDLVLYNRSRTSKYKFVHVLSFHLTFIYLFARNILKVIFLI